MARRTTEVGDLAVRGLAERHRHAGRNGRLGGGRRERRSARRGRRFSAVAVVAVALAAPLAMAPDSLIEHSETAGGSLAPQVLAEPVGGETTTADQAEDASVFARYEDLDLVLPGDGVRLVAYHEAAFPDALRLEPVGTKVLNDNRSKFSDPGTTPGPEYAILNARARATAATSAVDIAVDAETPIKSLVTGVVTDVEEYWLYGRHRDHRVELAPAGREDLRVVIIHVETPRLGVGDRVVAGETVIAPAARLFPFESQIDRYVGAPRGPHIHVEVKRHDG